MYGIYVIIIFAGIMRIDAADGVRPALDEKVAAEITRKEWNTILLQEPKISALVDSPYEQDALLACILKAHYATARYRDITATQNGKEKEQQIATALKNILAIISQQEE